VTRIWDPLRDAVERLAAACDIESVAPPRRRPATGSTPVLIVDDGSGEQWKYAAHPLKKGVPVFCDKPLAMTPSWRRRRRRWRGSTKTKFMSASSLRFVPDIVKLRGELAQIGPVYLASAACGNELVY